MPKPSLSAMAKSGQAAWWIDKFKVQCTQWSDRKAFHKASLCMELSSTIWNACQRLPKRFHWIHGLYQTSLQNEHWKCYRKCYCTESIRKLAKNPPCTVPSPIRMSALIISPVRGSTCHGRRKAGTRRQLNIRGLMGYDWIILELYYIYILYILWIILDILDCRSC